MSTDSPPLVERRRFPRIAPKGSVLFRSGGHEQRARIANLSEGGAFIVTTTRVPARLLARRIELDLRFDARSAQWLRASGTIVRVEAGGLAIALDALASPLLRVVDELLAASHVRARNYSIVLVDEDHARRSAIAAGFRAVGCTLIECNSPLEAIVRLGESSFEPDFIVLPESGRIDDDDSMRSFVELNHPAAKILTLTEDLLKPDGFAAWLSSAIASDAVLADRRRANATRR